MRSTAIADRPLRLDTPGELRRWSDRSRAAGMVVGLVPTMGALHLGHLSLIRRCRSEVDRAAVTIFVNPRQFGPAEDLDRYPRSLDEDLRLLSEEGVDAVLVPSVTAMYPEGHATAVRVTGAMGTTLEAAARPGHLDGVSLVVTKLLAAARPDRAYFGEKDAQQCAVVRRLSRDLDLGVDIVVCPTVREADGLAASSRNAFLGPGEREQARAIPAALSEVLRLHSDGTLDAAVLRRGAEALLARSALEVEYVAIVDPDTFEEVAAARPGCRCVVAARAGGTRLIDAVTLEGASAGVICETPGMVAAGGSAGEG